MIYSQRIVRGTIASGTLIASAIVALLSIASFIVVPEMTQQAADMRLEPSRGGVILEEIFTIQVVVTSETPVNVFAGQVRFDPDVLSVESIDYNTSIADLWAELPWYENGAGTINFTGGTTKRGGFTGEGSLITVTFKAHSTARTILQLEDARILAHDGLGTDVPLEGPIDAIFDVAESVLASETISQPGIAIARLNVSQTRPSTDLNGDGKQTIADVSIFMLNLFNSNDIRFDFNLDGVVNNKDLNMLIEAQ